ncbi:MAG TPA: creatininase family protein [Anaerolineae bacterium]|nr:creatininase family protein [Anaerolineae bacterium]HQI86670.1 creatininase family protein [Anaerolineae bacterium]HQK13440.1 creatininase family protein [Anaerolineae bacterium]
MQWENLTVAAFAEAVRTTGVCILALGVLEKHSEHLPLGTDYLNAHKIACIAAEREPAVVFPPFYFGQIYEARCFPGAVTLRPTLLLEVIQGVCDEIGRNGFKKIILFNGHGGNIHLLHFLAQCALWEEKPYSLYLPEGLTPERQARWEAIVETELHGHACECETSITLANYPELVDMTRVPAEPALPLNRLHHVPATYTGIWWYANYPNHYAGDARPATREKGLALRQLEVDNLAEYIAAVKADQVVPFLTREFFKRSAELQNPR